MALEYIAPSCFGADSLGLPAVAGNTPWGGMVERRPVQFRTIAGIHRPALGELARRPRSRVSQPLNTADRPTSHNGTIMQRGPLLQPLRSTELVLSGPPRAHPSGCVQPFRLRRAQPAPARALARCRASLASSLSHLSRSTGEANPPAGRVFLSAFAVQKPHSFPRGKPP